MYQGSEITAFYSAATLECHGDSTVVVLSGDNAEVGRHLKAQRSFATYMYIGC